MATDQEYLTGNRKIRYPFADDTVLSTEDSKALVVFGCFIDAFVQPKSDEPGFEPYVSSVSMDGRVLRFSLYRGPSYGDSVQLTCSSSRTARFPVVAGQTDWCWYSFVLSSDGIDEYSSSDVGDVSGDEMPLETRCLGFRSSDEVSAISVYGGTKTDASTGKRLSIEEALESEPDDVVTGDVTVETGNNMSFDEGLGSLSMFSEARVGRITLNAVPGAGAGTLPCSCIEAEGYRTPGLLCEDGHARVFNDTCYDLEPLPKYSTYVEAFGREMVTQDLKVHAKCKACCTCQMYESIVEDRLVPLKESILQSKDTLDEVLSKYESNVARWNARIATALPEDIVISMTAVPLDAAATDLTGTDSVTGKMNRCGVSVTVRNESFVTVDVAFDRMTTNGEVFESQLSYMDASLRPVVVRADGGTGRVSLPPGRSASLTCFIRLRNMVKTDAQTGFAAFSHVTATHMGRTVVSTEKSISI